MHTSYPALFDPQTPRRASSAIAGGGGGGNAPGREGLYRSGADVGRRRSRVQQREHLANVVQYTACSRTVCCPCRACANLSQENGYVVLLIFGSAKSFS